MAENISLEAIEDQLANARAQATAQGMQGEQIEAHARSVVFGDDPEIANEYDMLKAGSAVSSAEEDIQGSERAQRRSAIDALMARIQGDELAETRQNQVAMQTPDEQAQIRAFNEARAGMTADDFAAVQSGMQATVQADDARQLQASSQYPVGMVAGETLDPTQMTQEDMAGIQSSMRAMIQTGIDEGIQASSQYPVGMVAGETPDPGQLTEDEMQAMLRASTSPEEYGGSNPFQDQAEFTDAGIQDYRTAIAEGEAEQKYLEEEERSKAIAQRTLDRERAADSRGRQMNNLALQYMMNQQVGPSTIGEAMSGKYGQQQAQVTSDINALRMFFGERGKVQRGKMKEKEAERRMSRFRGRLASQEQRSSARATAKESQFQRSEERKRQNKEDYHALQQDLWGPQGTKTLLAVERMEKLGDYRSAMLVERRMSRQDNAKLARTREGRRYFGKQASRWNMMWKTKIGQEKSATNSLIKLRADLAKTERSIERDSTQANVARKAQLENEIFRTEQVRSSAASEAATFQSSAEAAERAIDEASRQDGRRRNQPGDFD